MSTTIGSNIQWPQSTNFVTLDRGTMALGVKDVSPFIPDVLTGSENFETDPISGSGTWTLTASVPHSGLRCLRSGVIGNNANTDYTFTVPGGTNFIRFWHRVSSELNFDFFQVYKNVAGVPANLLFQLSGTANVWAQAQFSMAGVTSVIFRYIKDGSSIGGLDTAFIDDIEWISTLGSAAVQQYEPFHLDTSNCVKVSLCSNHIIIDSLPEVEIKNDVGNPVPVSFTRLTCATDSVEICNNAGSPITVDVTNTVTVEATDFDIRDLDCATDSVTICPGDDPIVVVATDFDIRPLSCLTDSIEICNDTGNPVPVSFARLNCATDNIEICNDVGNPVPVVFPRLSCATDSVEICNDAGVPITVNVTNIPHVIIDSLPEVEIKNDAGNPIPVSFTRLNCATDSVEICNDAGSPITTNVTNTVTVQATDLDIRNLTCATDKVGACQEGTWNVNVTGLVVPGKRPLLGLYYATSGPITYTTAADSTTGGDLWLVNTSNTVVVYLRTVRFTALLDSLAILTNLPTIRMERMTFTGTPSGTLVTPAKRDSTDPTNTGTVRTAATGMVITAGAAIESFSPPTADVIGGLLAVNATASIPVEQLFVGDLESFITLRQNEGIVFRQNTAGNATENRQYWVNLVWEEI